ncbi:MAG TPA: metalloregulator ArsR/SmtB family transcription factor [Protaetiibacter sp.]|nr:metalloregulator ArsR/SmtB family transcription factor [Protaetiibacter sp.]
MPLGQLEQPLYEVKAGLFKGLSHPLRIRVLELLADGSERSVAELQAATGLEPSHLSQHLAVLRRQHLVASERRASHVYYRLAHPEAAELLAAARGLLASIVAGDLARAAEITALPALPK